MANQVVNVIKDKANIRTCTHRFDNYKRARAFAKANGAKVERTGDSEMKYRVVTVGEGIRP